MQTFDELKIGDDFIFMWEHDFFKFLNNEKEKIKKNINTNFTLPYILIYTKVGNNKYIGKEVLLNNNPNKAIKPSKIRGFTYKNAFVILVE